jgi:hypothetical protein
MRRKVSVLAASWAVLATCALSLCPDTGSAQSPLLSVTYNPGTSVKREQIIGDCDWDVYWHQQYTCLPTASATSNRFGVLGDGQLSSFESNGKLIVVGGDAISGDTNHNLHAFDPIGYSTTTEPEAGFLINFYTNANGSTVFVRPDGIQMGGDDLPTSGITLPGGTYLFVHTGHTNNNDQYVYSLLVKFDETVLTNFTVGRSVSSNALNGHFVHGALHAAGTNVCIFGIGSYRASAIYLSMISASNFWAGTGTRYFAGWTNGQPSWDAYESNAVPVVPQDASVGNVSVAYSTNLGLWLMTYDAGWNGSQTTNGIYFTYATEPWGPWAAPQLIFEKARDHALNVYIHQGNSSTNCSTGDGLMGPIIDQGKDPCPVDGVAFAPLLIERFITVSNNILSLYYTMGTFNPYTVVKMRSQFTVAPRLAIAPLNANHVQLTWPTNWNPVLEETKSLSDATLWKTSSLSVSLTDGDYSAVAPLNVQPRYFRLVVFPR